MGTAEILMLIKIISDLTAIIYLSKGAAAGMSEQQKAEYHAQQKELTNKLMAELITPPRA